MEFVRVLVQAVHQVQYGDHIDTVDTLGQFADLPGSALQVGGDALQVPLEFGGGFFQAHGRFS
ncbi:hypothetical protein D3C78_1792480 [compost metagenome]